MRLLLDRVEADLPRLDKENKRLMKKTDMNQRGVPVDHREHFPCPCGCPQLQYKEPPLSCAWEVRRGRWRRHWRGAGPPAAAPPAPLECLLGLGPVCTFGNKYPMCRLAQVPTGERGSMSALLPVFRSVAQPIA
jgi:hypothetical protein